MLKNEQGLTFVELLAAVVIMGFVTISAISIVVYGQKTTKDIQLQNEMRTYIDIATADLFLTIYNSDSSILTEKHKPRKKENKYNKSTQKWLTVKDLNKLPSQPDAYFQTNDGKITGLIIDEHSNTKPRKMNIYSDGKKIDLHHEDFYISEHSYIEPIELKDTTQTYKIVLYVFSNKEQRAFAMESLLYSFSDGRKLSLAFNKYWNERRSE